MECAQCDVELISTEEKTAGVCQDCWTKVKGDAPLPKVQTFEAESTADIPMFKDADEMLAFFNDQAKKMKKDIAKVAKPEKKPRSQKSRKKEPADKDTTDIATVVPELDPRYVYQTIHFYTRPETTWELTLKQAKEEKGYRNVNVRVNAHNHNFQEACSDTCRVV